MTKAQNLVVAAWVESMKTLIALTKDDDPQIQLAAASRLATFHESFDPGPWVPTPEEVKEYEQS